MLENMAIFPYENGNFEESKQRYILIAPATFVPSLTKQGSFGLLTKLQEWCLVPGFGNNCPTFSNPRYSSCKAESCNAAYMC